MWKQRVTLAARFGSPKMLPSIESSGAQQLLTNPNDSGVAGALLAAEIREDPKMALSRLERERLSAISWYETNKVFESAHHQFPMEVEMWLRNQVQTANDEAAAQAAYELSIGGTAEDRDLIEQRLASLRLKKAGSSGDKPVRSPRRGSGSTSNTAFRRPQCQARTPGMPLVRSPLTTRR